VNTPTFKTFENKESLFKCLAEDVTRILVQGIKQRDRTSFVVSGGKTPQPFFQALKDAKLNWDNVFLTLADERWVPVDHVDSNEKLVRDSLRVEGLNFVSLKSSAANPYLGAVDVNRNLAAMPKPFDVVILGMGDDGHTASLFPNTKDLKAALYPENLNALCVGLTPPDYAPHPRITLTLPALLDSKKIIILITGEKKKRVYLNACEEGPIEDLPIRAILKQQKTLVEVYWTAEL
jgi:6-phosphogluconolactonase